MKGLWTRVANQNLDTRGSTTEFFNINELPVRFIGTTITQILESRSSYGVIRGIHYASTNNTQAKIVRCMDGTILDIVIDLRVDSPTFGKFETFEMSSSNNLSIYISHGFGHAYQVLSQSATVLYALQTDFNFSEEFSINPFDADLNLPWHDIPAILSPRDASAPGYEVAINNSRLD